MKRPLAFFCLVLSLVLALFTLIFKPDYPDYSSIARKEIKVTGKVDSVSYRPGEAAQLYDSAQSGAMKMTVVLKDASILSSGYGNISDYRNIPRNGKIICYMADSAYCPKIGATITLNGKAFTFEPATNPGQFDSRQYYRILHIDFGMYSCRTVDESTYYSRILNTLFDIRRNLSQRLDDILPPREASVMKTMLLGESSEIDADLKSLYQRNGISHILSISGLHISIIGIGLYKLLRKIFSSIIPSAVISCVFMFLYGLMTGFGVSSRRAVFMFSISMLANIMGRTYDILTALSLGACLILLEEPLYIYHSGFCYSFGCVLGLVLLTPVLTPDFTGKNIHPLLQRILSGCIMTVTNLPLNLWFSYGLPLYAVILNLFIIPAMSVLVLAGIVLLAVSYIFIPATFPAKILITGILGLFESMAMGADSLPVGYYCPGRPSFLQLAIFLTILVFICIYKKKLKFPVRITVVGVACILLLIRRGGLDIATLDVGQGDCNVIHCCTTPIRLPGVGSDYTMIIDSGSSDTQDIGKYRLIPYLKYSGATDVDAIVITHTDADHISGITELLELCDVENIKIHGIYLSDIDDTMKTDAYYGIVTQASALKIPVTLLKTGDILSPVKNLEIRCIWPSSGYFSTDLNSSSLVMYLKYNTFSALFTGDIGEEAEESMVDLLSQHFQGQNLDYLKCGHHGSSSSTTRKLLELTHPKYTGISCGLNNSYGHPHQETLDRLNQVKSTVLRTDADGAILIHYGRGHLAIHKSNP